ncbi:MAG TPA: phosphotransferase, partial [Kineosporiaceae bacterium]|nr:phosphotransferase [Kineosporiaceae bacterium]
TVAALDALAGTRLAGEAEAVRAAWWELPARARAGTPGDGSIRLVHGDWHFGQLVADRTGSWRLSDVDDLGVGDPLWDLGRPAAFCAIGVVTAAEFGGFLDAYRAAGGSLPGPDLAWQALDVPARAYVVQTAARNLLAAHRTGADPDEVTAELLAACLRMTRGSVTRGNHGTLRPTQR